MENLTGQQVKGYELREEIGAGGFGAVYRAYQSAIDREVAVKIILPEYANNAEFIRRFESEAQMVARLEHLHIVPLYDYWREPDSAFLVMRYLRGGSARNMLEQRGPWALPDISRLLQQITSALAVAHRNQIIHRDLKPDNILLDTSNNYFLADFGIAKDMSNGDVNKTGPIIGSPAYFSPEQIRGLPVMPSTDVYSLGICLFELLTGQHPYEGTRAEGMIFKHLSEPVPDVLEHRTDVPPAINEVIRQATAKEQHDRFTDIITLSLAFQQALGTNQRGTTAPLRDTATAILQQNVIAPDITPVMGVTIPEPENPYKGLRAFREADSDDFFGRDKLVKKLLRRIEAARLLTVIGPSGSGKSSVVHAGVIPALRRGAVGNSRSWFYVTMHPGTNPLKELESALLRIAVNPPSRLIDQLQENERGLLRALKRTLPDDDSELLLTIDQLEELFTLVEDDAVRVHFLNSLRTAIEDPRSRLRVITTLRADFYDRPLLYPEIGEIVRQSTAVVLPLSRQELETAITAPAERVGLIVEPQLVSAIIQDVGASAGTLPLLQYALTELYERRDGRMLTTEAYRAIGGVSGALARRAEEIYVDLWEPTKQTARQVFLRLVNLGEGTEDTRRRVLRSELLTLNPDEVDDAVEYCLDQFGKYRLITFDHDRQTREPTVEVAHEALIGEWGRLREWLEDNRDDLRTQRKLYGAAEEWENAGRDPSFLAQGTRLNQFQEWQRTSTLTMNDLEEDYLAESTQADEQRHAEEEAQRQREAELERRSRRRLRAFLVLAAFAAVAGMVLSIFAFNQSRTAQANANALATSVMITQGERLIAERNAAEAQSLALAASAQQAFSASDNDLAIALALRANTIDNPPAQSRRVLAEAAYAPGTRRIFSGHTNQILGVAYSNNGERIASASADGTLRLWDAATGETIQRFTGHSAAVNDVAISRNGLQVLSASADGSARVWDVASGEVIASVRPADGSGMLTAEFSPDGLAALIGDATGNVYLWNLTANENLQTFAGHSAPIYDTAYSPRGSTFISAAGDTTMRLWSVNTGQEVRRLLGHEARVYTVAIGPDGTTGISGDADGNIIVWDVRFGQQIKQFFGHTSAVNALEITPDGRFAVSGSADGTVRVWDIETSEEVRRFRGHSAAIDAVAISPDGRQVISGAQDNTIRMWDLQSGAEIRRMTDRNEAFTDAVISQDGAFILTGGRNGGLATWDINTGTLIRTLSTTKGTVGALEASQEDSISVVALSPNDRLALSGTRSGMVVIWDVNSGTDLRRIQLYNNVTTAAAFLPDNRQVLIAGANSQLVRLDVGSGETIYETRMASAPINALQPIPSTETYLAGANDGALFILDANDGSLLRELGQHTDSIQSIAVDPNGERALTGSRDRSVRLWDLTPNVPNPQITRFDGHTGSVSGVAISEDLRFALSGDTNHNMIMWDLSLETPVQQLTGHNGAINAIHYLPGSTTAVSATLDGAVHVWQTVDLPNLVAWTNQNRYSATLTCAQREQYRIQPLCENSPS
jgi:WD40 repeat protein/serine/threonine protein kinase